MKSILTIMIALVALDAAGQIYVPSGGVQTVANGSNNVGIGGGSSSPTSKLRIVTNSTDNMPALFVNGGSNGASNYVTYFKGRGSTFGSTVLHLTSDRVSDSGYNFIEAIQDEDGTPSTAFLVRGDGNVGIGTSSPSNLLDIVNGSGKATLRIKGTTLSDSWRARLLLDRTDDYRGAGTWITSSSGSEHDWFIGVPYSGAGFTVGYHATQPEYKENSFLFLKTNGLMGVGTTSPGTKLHVFHSSSGFTPDNVAGLFVENSGSDGAYYVFQTASVGGGKSFSVTNSGNVGIGTTAPDAKLAVNGTIHGTEVRVTTSVPGPDYVFAKDYALPSLESIQSYINQNQHLPEVPSAKEMEENGVKLGEMNMLLLKKVEELTLHLIDQDEKNKELQKQVDHLKSQIESITTNTR